MISIITSKNNVQIRLTDERWAHITEEHAELAGMRLDVLETVAEPDRILAGGQGELGKFMVVVYREAGTDGFIITAGSSKSHVRFKQSFSVENVCHYMETGFLGTC